MYGFMHLFLLIPDSSQSMDSGVLRLLAARGSYTDGAAGDGSTSFAGTDVDQLHCIGSSHNNIMPYQWCANNNMQCILGIACAVNGRA